MSAATTSKTSAPDFNEAVFICVVSGRRVLYNPFSRALLEFDIKKEVDNTAGEPILLRPFLKTYKVRTESKDYDHVRHDIFDHRVFASSSMSTNSKDSLSTSSADSKKKNKQKQNATVSVSELLYGSGGRPKEQSIGATLTKEQKLGKKFGKTVVKSTPLTTQDHESLMDEDDGEEENSGEFHSVSDNDDEDIDESVCQLCKNTEATHCWSSCGHMYACEMCSLSVEDGARCVQCPEMEPTSLINAKILLGGGIIITPKEIAVIPRQLEDDEEEGEETSTAPMDDDDTDDDGDDASVTDVDSTEKPDEEDDDDDDGADVQDTGIVSGEEEEQVNDISDEIADEAADVDVVDSDEDD